MKQRNLTALFLIALAAIFVLAACGEQTPVPVYVTPTQEVVTIAAAPTATPLPTATPSPSPSPSLTPTIPPTVTPSAAATQPPTIPPGVTYGPLVGPNHTLIPTETRVPPTLPPTSVPTAGPSPTPLPGLNGDLMGVQIHPHIDSHEYDLVLGRVRELGIGWLKLQFNWGVLETAPGHYTPEFYMLRQYIQRAHTDGLRVMISVAKAPGWARDRGPDGSLREAGPPRDPELLASFIRGTLEQVGVDVFGQPYISAVEIWNEPNLEREWYGHPMTGAEYMRYFRPAFDAIYSFSPEIVVITAAPAPTGDSQWSADDRVWLQQLYDAGLASYGQNVAVGIHPYGWANPPETRCCDGGTRGWDDRPQFFFLDTIEDYRAIMVANGHANAQLWTTEFGWATFDGLQTTGGGPPPDPAGDDYLGHIDQWQQADYTLRAFQLGQDRPYLGPMILWNLNFSTLIGAIDQGDPKAAYGMVNHQWQPRPVYLYLKNAPKS